MTELFWSKPLSALTSKGVVCLTIGLLLTGCNLGAQKDESATDPRNIDQILSEGRTHDDPYVRAETIKMLSYAPHDTWSTDVEAMLEDGSPLVVAVAAEALLPLGVSPRATTVVEGRLRSGSEQERLVMLELASQHMPVEKRLELLHIALDGKLETVRRAGVASLVRLLEDGDAPSPSEERELEQWLATLATDTDIVVAATAMRYLSTVDRLESDHDRRVDSLLQVVREGQPADQVRALRILVELREERAAPAALDLWHASSKNLQDDPVASLAMLAIAADNPADRIVELEELTIRDNSTLQRLALNIVVGAELADSDGILYRALEAGSEEAKLNLLRQFIAQKRKVRLPDSLLKDPSLDVRVLALRVLWLGGEKPFVKRLRQKLEVEQYRGPILEGLATWAEMQRLSLDFQPGRWLTAIAPVVEGLKADYGDRPGLSVSLHTLLVYSNGVETYLDDIRSLPPAAQYVVLRSAVEAGARTDAAVTAYRTGLDSSLFAVRLCGAVGLRIAGEGG